MIEYYLLIMIISMSLWALYFVLLVFTTIIINSNFDNIDLIILLVSCSFIFLYPIVIYNAIIFSICYSLIKLFKMIESFKLNSIERTFSYRENAK